MPPTDDSTRPPDDERTRRIAGRVLVGIGSGLAALTVMEFRDAFVDDAYISLRYAKNLLAGNGLVFNPGELVEGITNLGYVLIVAVLGLAMDLTTAAVVLGVTGAIVAIVLGPATVLPDPSAHFERAIARVLLLANFAFVFMAITGLETVFYSGAICLTAFVFTKHEQRFGLRVGLLCGALFMIRPDGLLIGAALALVSLLQWGPKRLLASPGAWAFGAAVVAVEAWRFHYYGALVPNTALVKGPVVGIGGFAWYGAIGDDVVELLAQSGGAASVLFAWIAVFVHAKRPPVRIAVAICAALLFFEAYAGGDWMLTYRFMLPALPFYVSLVALGIGECLRRLQQSSAPSARKLVWGSAAGILVIAFSCWSFGLQFRARVNEYPYTHMTSTHLRAAAEWIDARYPPDYTLQATLIGAVAYSSERVVIDALGLTDREIALARGDFEREEEYLAGRNPELVLQLGATSQPTDPTSFLIHGRPYALANSFDLGDMWWWLFVREDARLD